MVVADLDSLPTVAAALTEERYDALSGNTDRGETATQLFNALQGPRFAVLQGRRGRAFEGNGRFRLRSGAPVLASAGTYMQTRTPP